MIDELIQNVESEIQIAKEMAAFINKMPQTNPAGQKLIGSMIESHRKKIKILNNSIPQILSNISLARRIGGEPLQQTLHQNTITKKTNPNTIEKIQIGIKDKNSPAGLSSDLIVPVNVALMKKDKGDFFKELNISQELLKKIKRRGIVKKKQSESYHLPKGYAKASNYIFRETAAKLLAKGGLHGLRVDLKKSNMNILPITYVSMMLLGILISLIVGFFVSLFLVFFDISLTFPFITAQTGNILPRILKMSWIFFTAPLATLVIFYFYPYTEKRSLGSRIDQELPFVVIHMSSISASGIEPTQIFKIIGMNKEYKYNGGEIRKLLNQINIYGYDLVTALKNLASSTPSKNLAELLNGLATSIKTGGNLNSFLNKRAETLLLGYRLEREKFSKTAETFMDIYISVVIAAPMILLLLLVMISVSGISIGPGIGFMTLGMIVIVITINVLFLMLLGMKQPKY